jgi:hypothetical protein
MSLQIALNRVQMLGNALYKRTNVLRNYVCLVVVNYDQFMLGPGQSNVQKVHILGHKVRMLVVLRNHHFIAKTEQNDYIVLQTL